jgi:hypothetical protein
MLVNAIYLESNVITCNICYFISTSNIRLKHFIQSVSFIVS